MMLASVPGICGDAAPLFAIQPGCDGEPLAFVSIIGSIDGGWKEGIPPLLDTMPVPSPGAAGGAPFDTMLVPSPGDMALGVMPYPAFPKAALPKAVPPGLGKAVPLFDTTPVSPGDPFGIVGIAFPVTPGMLDGIPEGPVGTGAGE